MLYWAAGVEALSNKPVAKNLVMGVLLSNAEVVASRTGMLNRFF